MRFFISITAFGNYKNTIDQIENLYDKNNFYFVHWNKRDEPKKNIKELREYFKKYNNIVFYSKYKVYWGHISILKVTNYAIKNFLKKEGYDYFINLDNKTIACKKMEEIYKYIDKNKNNNFMGLMRKHYDYSTLNEIDYWEKQRESYLKEESWRRKFHYRLMEQNNRKLIFIIFFIIENLNYFLRNLIKFKNLIKACKNLFFHSEIHPGFWMNCYSKKIVKNKTNLEMIFMNQIGTFLFIKRDDLVEIYKSKEFSQLYKTAKFCYAPEEFFYPTLFYNLIDKNNNNSLCIHLSTNINLKRDANKWKKIKKDILFIRRVIGKDEINNVNKILNNIN